MSGESDRRTSRDVAHEAEDTRAHLASTLEQLRTNLRPENVVDEVMSNARAGAASMAGNLAGVARANPLPSLLIAAGVFVVMGVMSRGGRSRSEAAGTPDHLPPASRLREPVTYPVSTEAGAPAEGLHLDPASNWADEVGHDADRSRPGLTAGVEGLKRGAARAYGTAASGVQDAARSLADYVPQNRREVKSKLSNLLDDQPLILGAIGLAVGAAVGAALPITEAEDNVMGGPSHQLRQAATDVARHEVDGLRAVAGEAVENIKKAAADHGVSSSNLQSLVKDVGAEARAAVDKAGSVHGA